MNTIEVFYVTMGLFMFGLILFNVVHSLFKNHVDKVGRSSGKEIDHILKPNLSYKEVRSILTMNIFNTLIPEVSRLMLTSKSMSDGTPVVMGDFSKKDGNLLPPIMAMAISNMGDGFIRDYHYYESSDPQHLMVEVYTVANMYIHILMERLVSYQSDIKNINAFRIKDGKTELDATKYIYDKLNKDIADDCKDLYLGTFSLTEEK